jgi:hypothetical protein
VCSAYGQGPQAWTSFPHSRSGAASGQFNVQAPLPVQVMLQKPLHTASQLPFDLQSMLPRAPSSAWQFPEPVQLTAQSSAQRKSQAPEPAH